MTRCRKTKRSAANQWFANTLLSRLDDKRTGAIVIVMQRVHMDDLTGFLLSQSNERELLSLPAIAEFEETIPLGNGHQHRRQVGEALSPEREPLHVLEALKLQIGSDAFSAQYQQAPVPPGGAMVKRQWARRYGDELPPPAERLMTVQSWDIASKGGPDNAAPRGWRKGRSSRSHPQRQSRSWAMSSSWGRIGSPAPTRPIRKSCIA